MLQEEKKATSTVVAKQFVNARELHKILGSTYRFNDWINRRIEEYSFVENEDYFNVDNNPRTVERFAVLCLSSTFEITENNQQKEVEFEISNRHDQKDYILTLDMAKELAMVEKNEVGRKVRKYFIEVEKRFRLLESKYRNFVEQKQTQLEELHEKRKGAKVNFNEARNLLNGIENEIREVLKLRFNEWQDNQRVQPLPLVFEE